MPVLGLIFLRHADNRFKAYLPEIEADIPSQVSPGSSNRSPNCNAKSTITSTATRNSSRVQN